MPLLLWRFVTALRAGVTECCFLSHGMLQTTLSTRVFSGQKLYL